MGIIAQGRELWDALFTRTQRQVLSLLFGHPERSYYATEIVRLAGVGTGSVQRELAKLSACGLLTVSRVGNQKHYQANPESPIFAELRSIVLKTFGAMGQLRTALQELDGEIRLAMIYGPGVGTLTAGSAEIRMLIVSDDLEYATVVSGLTETENRIGRTIEPLLLSWQEFQARLAGGDRALLDMLGQPRVVLKGKLDDTDV